MDQSSDVTSSHDGEAVLPVENSDLEDGYEAYRQYITMKSHFGGTYDISKFKGAIKTNRESYNRRKDQIFFRIIQTRYKPSERNQIFLSNLIYDKHLWVGDCLAEQCISIWNDWKGRLSRLDYQFEEDVKAALDEFQIRKPEMRRAEGLKLLIKKPTNKHPLVLRFVWGGMFSIESYLLLSKTLKLKDVYQPYLTEDPLWKDFENKMERYDYFLGKKLNIEKTKETLKRLIKE